ncbi:hypothetical protein GCM10027059_29540 [Myceligenerans halotolerans]
MWARSSWCLSRSHGIAPILSWGYLALGATEQARTHYEYAHLIYTELDRPEADEVLARLVEVRAAAG